MSPIQFHLVGSSPFGSAEGAFTRFTTELPGRLVRIPDGEPGERKNFTVWQQKVFPPQLWSDRFIPQENVVDDPNFVLQPEHLQPTGFDEAAISSYKVFRELRDQNIIPHGVRFMVGLPTPINVVMTWVKDKYLSVAEELYEKLLLANIATIQNAIPHEDLSIQFDMPIEISHMENTYGIKREGAPWYPKMLPWYSPVKEGILDRTIRLVAAVHPGVEFGIHWCYGDLASMHWVEPIDLGILVEMTNAVTAKARRVDFFHMPVPKGRTDDAYYAPLKQMKAENSTLYLGLVHAEDEDGTRARMHAAKKALGQRSFGVSTECGLGRMNDVKVKKIFEVARRVTGGEI